MKTSREQILAVAAELGLTMTTEFVPFSQSRNKAEKQPSLNWCVTLNRGGRPILTTDYMAGCAHAPSYKQGDRTMISAQIVAWECEHGRRGRWFDNNVGPVIQAGGAKSIEPDFADVLHSLAMDYDVLDYPTYEDWAPELGYDPDSRSGEVIYRACVEIALKLRSGIGEDGMVKLREAGQDY